MIQVARLHKGDYAISLESSEDVGVGTILGGVDSHIKVFMLHPLKDQSGLFIKGLKFKHYWGDH